MARRSGWMAVAAILVIIAAPVHAAEGFRGVPWGSSRDEVVARLGEPLLEGEDYLAYRDTIAGYEVLAMCMFSDDVLVGGGYTLSEDFVNSNRYLEAYDRFAELLEEKYGPPLLNRNAWKGGSLYKDSPEYWGLAVSMGYLERMADWETPETRIVLWLKGENFEVNLYLGYYSRAHQSQVQEKRAAETESKL